VEIENLWRESGAEELSNSAESWHGEMQRRQNKAAALAKQKAISNINGNQR